MPTHLHVIFVFDRMKEGLPEVVRTFKALVTRNAGVKFWQRNYYEHVIRNENALFKIREYIENNPLAERIRFEEFYESGSDIMPEADPPMAGIPARLWRATPTKLLPTIK